MKVKELIQQIKTQEPIIKEAWVCSICKQPWNGQCRCEQKHLIKGSAMRIRTLHEVRYKCVEVGGLIVERSTLLNFLYACKRSDYLEIITAREILTLMSFPPQDQFTANFTCAWRKEK